MQKKINDKLNEGNVFRIISKSNQSLHGTLILMAQNQYKIAENQALGMKMNACLLLYSSENWGFLFVLKKSRHKHTAFSKEICMKQ